MMRHDLYEDMFLKEQDYWWHVGKRLIVYKLLEKYLTGPKAARRTRRALDLGCGTGRNLDSLARYATPVGLDSANEALEFCRTRGHHHLVQALSLPFAPNSFDIVTALDVVEHVDDDLATMRDLYTVMRPGGMLLISVPAYMQLWSYWDDILGHRRRYTTKTLRWVVEQAGFEVRKVSHSNMAILVPASLLRMVKGLRHRAVERAYTQGFTSEPSTPETDFVPVPRPINTLLTAYYHLESRMLRRRNLPFGLSVVCVAQKPLAENAAPGAKEGTR
jgi:2-polyprenyl-3-methyl-5-hydroxy-6-metoxy-1,4-benzoquinol methylase